MTNKHFALVIQGGGTRTAFTSGVLDVMMKNELYADYVIGVSAGALMALNYVSHDIGRNAQIVKSLILDKKFYSIRNFHEYGSVFNFGYLLRGQPKNAMRFNEKLFWENPARLSVVATSCETGKAVYFEKSMGIEFWNAVAASASLPFASKPFFVAGEPYLDGGTSESIPFGKPMEDGYRKIVVIMSRHKGYRKRKQQDCLPLLADFEYRGYPVWRQACLTSYAKYNHDADEIEKLGDEGRIFVIYPEAPILIGHACKNRDKLDALNKEGELVGEKILSALNYYLSSSL